MNEIKTYKLTNLYSAHRVAEYKKREAQITRLMHAGYTANYIIWLRQQNWRWLTADGTRELTHSIGLSVKEVAKAA